jgi:hypothetical protein
MLRVVCFGMPNTDWRQCDVRASAEGVRWHAALGRAHTRLPLSSATWAHFCIPNRPRACQPPPAGGPLAADLSNCTRRISVGDGRVAAGVSELGPAMSDGESGFPANYSRSGPTIIRDYSRRPRRGRAHAPDYGAAEPGLRSHWPRIKVGSGNLNRGRRQLKPGPRTWTKANSPL